MRTLIPGHSYELDDLKGTGEINKLDFYMDPNYNNGATQVGTSNQEVLRALINRTLFLDAQCPGPENKAIIEHLRAALILHETRAIRRKLEKYVEVEELGVYANGHIFDELDEA